MKILLTGTEGSGIERAGHELRIAGHLTETCITGSGDRGRCRAGDDPAACPFADGVDLIVAAREHPLPHLSRQELLTSCALLHEVPLVVAGATITNPYGGRAALVVEGFDGLAVACEAVLAGRVPMPLDEVAVAVRSRSPRPGRRHG
jgi:hypothetical protein